MSSEWLQVMLEEIARKKAQAEQDRLELERRVAEHAAAAAQRERVAARHDDVKPESTVVAESTATNRSA